MDSPCLTKQNRGNKKIRSGCITKDSSNIRVKDPFSSSIRFYKPLKSWLLLSLADKAPSFQCWYFYCTSLAGIVSVYKMETTASLKVPECVKNELLLLMDLLWFWHCQLKDRCEGKQDIDWGRLHNAMRNTLMYDLKGRKCCGPWDSIQKKWALGGSYTSLNAIYSPSNCTSKWNWGLFHFVYLLSV